MLESGLVDGGAYIGDDGRPPDRSGVVFEVAQPHWMPMGEVRVHDPDGFVLLVGQSAQRE
jgi:hypothetical protein